MAEHIPYRSGARLAISENTPLCFHVLARGEAEAAVEPCFETAIGIARRQGARSWELRAAMSFAR
jgi:hypothetical protein